MSAKMIVYELGISQDGQWGDIVFRDGNGNEDYIPVNFLLTSEEPEELLECETYNDYGQKIGCEDSGCYSLENSYSQKDVLEDIMDGSGLSYNDFDFESQEEMDDEFSSYTANDLLDYLPKDKKKVFQKWRNKVERHSECLGYNYRKGNNWGSMIIEYYDNSWDTPIFKVSRKVQKEIQSEFEDYKDNGNENLPDSKYVFGYMKYDGLFMYSCAERY